MTTVDAEKLVQELEELNKSDNLQFRFRVRSMLMRGYWLIHGTWISTVVLLGIVGWAIFYSITTGQFQDALWPKLLIVAGLGLVVLLVMAGRFLFYAPPLPVSFEISEKDAPQLFAILEEIRQKIEGRHFSRVYLNTEIKASVLHVPHFMGLFRGETNLVIGLPLLAALSVEETKAVLAHESAHLVQGRDAFAAWVYRNRRLWLGVGSYVHRVGGFLSRPVIPFFKWYLPQVSAHALINSREFKYQADQLSARMTNKKIAIRAILLVHALSLYMEEGFAAEMKENTKTMAQVPEGMFNGMLQAIQKVRESGDLNDYIDEPLAKRKNIFDSRPTLVHRLAALDMEEVPDLTCQGETGLSMLKESWDVVLPLGELAMQKQWEKAWSAAHEEHLRNFIILKRIHSADSPPNKWTDLQVLEYAQAARVSSDYETAWDWVNHYIELKPDEAIGFLIRGEMSFERQNDICLDDFRRAAMLAPQFAPEAYRRAISFADRYRPESDTTADREALREAELKLVPENVEIPIDQED